MAAASPARLAPAAPPAAARLLSPRAAPLLLLVLLAGVVAATRLPLAPPYLFSFDNVNLALALERFDPRLHQPQPPGYPLFVGQARLLNWFFHSPERTLS